MNRNASLPMIISGKNQARPLKRLPKAHEKFNETYLQELLVEHPGLLPVDKLRSDAGNLLCIGREVPVGSSGIIDNLYLSTGGYPVIVETKLWRNPQARREVLSQILDYIKEAAGRDFEWLENVWNDFTRKRFGARDKLMDKLNSIADDELDEKDFIDRVNIAMTKGDILAVIVGDGIETRLQQLVSHLCKDTAHLRYSLALVELGCYIIDENTADSDMLVIPRIIQDVEPVQRAYVRIDLASDIEQKLQVNSIVCDESSRKSKHVRTILNEEGFLNELENCVGSELRHKIERFYQDISVEYELEPEFKSAAVMLKIPDAMGEKPGVSLLGIERQGRIYNTRHIKGQLKRWGITDDTALKLTSDFWNDLHKVEPRFPVDGISHMSPGTFINIKDIEGELEEIKKVIGKAAARIREVINYA